MPLLLKFCANLARLFEVIPETPMCTGFIRAHFETNFYGTGLFRLSLKAAAGIAIAENMSLKKWRFLQP